MPYALSRPCRKSGCPNLTNHPRGYCLKHLSEKYRQEDANRSSSNERGYDYQWHKLRNYILAKEPLCRKCQAEGLVMIATEVHHIDGNVYNLDESNLEPLCHECHSRETAKGQAFHHKA